MKLASLVGKPAEALLAALPNRAQELVADASGKALTSGLDWAVRSIPDEPPQRAAGGSRRRQPPLGSLPHGGHGDDRRGGRVFRRGGLADRAAGHHGRDAPLDCPNRGPARADFADPQVRLQCLAVFSFGAPQLDTMESAYFTGRLGLALAVKDAARFVGQHTAREVSEAVTKGTAPMLVRLVNQIAARFQVVVSEKVLAQAVPLVGAASGALINAAFSDHFNTVARYHFGIVALERKHGRDAVEAEYRGARQCVLDRAGGRR